MLNDNEYQEIEGRQYINPQVALDESNSFIENLRNTQQQNTQQISTDTQRLGTNVPTSLGGLTGSQSYWTSRYQTPQTNALVADLRSTAQAKALNDALATEQAIWQKRYQDAYRAYQKRQYDKANTPTTTSPTTTAGQGEVTKTVTDDEVEARGGLNISGDDISRGGQYIVSPDVNSYGGHDIIWVTPSGQNITIPQLSDGSYATSDIREFVRRYGGANLPFMGGN